VSLRGWMLRDTAGHVYRFTGGRIGGGKNIFVHTGPDRDTFKRKHWGRLECGTRRRQGHAQAQERQPRRQLQPPRRVARLHPLLSAVRTANVPSGGHFWLRASGCRSRRGPDHEGEALADDCS